METRRVLGAAKTPKNAKRKQSSLIMLRGAQQVPSSIGIVCAGERPCT